MRLILLGAPGAGKGTQGALLAKSHGLQQVSTGDILRDAVRRGTPLGREAQRYMDAGELVPDDVILGLVRDVLAGADEGDILDGFPRTLEQARGLDGILDDLGTALDAVVVLEVPDETLVKRISGRRSCPECKAVYNVYFDPPSEEGVCDQCGAALTQRKDDTAETVERRLEVYRAQTEPLIRFYQESDTPVRMVDGRQDAAAVQADIERVLGE
ncbi:MAG TPA: adenylate kinase [Longimicrobiales bacterium]|nr:adenylate kinase [Longimicrobiales bacterium]